MKPNTFLKAFFLAIIFILSSCATTKYSEETYKNDYTHLQTGRTYKFEIKGSKKMKKMIFSRTTQNQIIGYASKRDSTIIALDKSNVTKARDTRKSAFSTSAIAIGTAATAALIITSSRAD